MDVCDRLVMETIRFNQESVQRKPLTLGEYDALPPEDGPWLEELVRGHVVREPLPVPYHGSIQANIAALLHQHVRATKTGFVFTHAGVETEDDPRPSVRGPDVGYISRDRASEADMMRKRLPVGPDLAVEVISPSNTAAEMQEKVLEYLAAGSREVWLVYPSTRQVIAHTMSREIRAYTVDDIIESDTLPGFRAAVKDFFEL